MNKPEDSYDSAIMRVLVQPLLDEDIARFDEYNKIPHEFSETFERKIKRVFQREKVMSYGRASLIWMRRVAICAMVGAMILLVSCAAVRPLREKIVNAVVEWYTEYVAVYFESNTSDPMLKRLTYVPEKYIIVQDICFEDYAFIRYEDDNGNLITFTCKPTGEDVTLYDQERHSVEDVMIHENSGLYFMGDNEYSIITWKENDVTYTISGALPKMELVEMAESVK